MADKKKVRSGYGFPNTCWVRLDKKLQRMSKSLAHQLQDEGRDIKFVSRSKAKKLMGK